MNYALDRVLPDDPPGGVSAGVDWGNFVHAACVADTAGRVADRFTVANDMAGISALTGRLLRSGAREAAIERGDGPLADALTAGGLTLVVIPPGQVQRLRERHVSSGAKDDHFDAFVLADALRTDRARLRPLVPDSPEALALRSAVRARKELVAQRVAAASRLREHLRSAFPGAIGLFSELDSPVSPGFLRAFPSREAAAGLDGEAIAAWLQTVPRRGNTARPEVLASRLAAAAPGAGHDGRLSEVTRVLAASVAGLASRIRDMEDRIAGQLDAHPDAGIFLSLPRAATLRAARLLAETGDSRARYPSARSLAAAAGVCPVTRRSGQRISHEFRWAADPHLRDAWCDWAGDTPNASPWAAEVYERAREGGKRHPHAARILACAWIRVVWPCWQAGIPYDPARHRALQDVLARQAAARAEAEAGGGRQ
jgi:transposase